VRNDELHEAGFAYKHLHEHHDANGCIVASSKRLVFHPQNPAKKGEEVQSACGCL
jgi:hypothetical protein